ncbi:MAG: hypothetical protein RL264_345 [Bacteroidota bacterium]|jgi:choice-of-anchor B domain-containing protein
MKFLLFPLFIFCGGQLFAQAVKNVELLDHWFTDTLITNSSEVRFSSCWAFVHEGKEYGVIGSTEGAHFFELTSENTFRFVDFVPGRFQSSQAITREYKNYGNYLYAVCDEGNSSLQIIDLSFLPDSVRLVSDLRDANFGKSHNLFIDSTRALLYLCLVTPALNNVDLPRFPLAVYSLENPTAPQLLWQGPEDIPEVHDLYLHGNIALLNCGFNGIRVYDFTNPSAPIYKNSLSIYPKQGYNHQGWLAPNGSTYVFADETAGMPIKRARLNADFSISIEQFFGTPNEPYDKTPHNIHCTNEFAFVAYYNDGLRIYDLRFQPPVEIGAYDTYLDNSLTNNFSMWGAWGIHALLPSERILISDRNNGFFLFSFDRQRFINQANSSDFSLYPNPVNVGSSCTIRAPKDGVDNFQVRVMDLSGKLISEQNVQNQSFCEVEVQYIGCFLVEVRYENYLGEETVRVFRMVGN